MFNLWYFNETTVLQRVNPVKMKVLFCTFIFKKMVTYQKNLYTLLRYTVLCIFKVVNIFMYSFLQKHIKNFDNASSNIVDTDNNVA